MSNTSYSIDSLPDKYAFMQPSPYGRQASPSSKGDAQICCRHMDAYSLSTQLDTRAAVTAFVRLLSLERNSAAAVTWSNHGLQQPDSMTSNAENPGNSARTLLPCLPRPGRQPGTLRHGYNIYRSSKPQRRRTWRVRFDFEVSLIAVMQATLLLLE